MKLAFTGDCRLLTVQFSGLLCLVRDVLKDAWNFTSVLVAQISVRLVPQHGSVVRI